MRQSDMNVILPRYAGAIAEFVVGDHVEVNVASTMLWLRLSRSTLRRRGPTGLAVMPVQAELKTAANAAGKSEILDRYAADYPQGPHDQPQSMCPAFGSLRVGLRMRRTATILSGSACCVYGLTFTSHFYGARRTVGYVPFNSETLVTGKLFEDIREAVFKLADPALYDTIIITNLCVPTASGVPLRPAAEGDQRRTHHRHRCAGFRRADPCRGKGRAGRRDARICAQGSRAGAGAGAARRQERAANGRSA